jgi:serine/threonine protein phosphatase PrpC
MSDKWKAIARSVAGTSHLEKNTPCQDHGDYKPCREYLIGAVSDGAGSRSLSEHGSELAVEVTLKYLTDILENSRRTNPFASQSGAEDIFRDLIDRVREAISQKASDWSRDYNRQVSAGDFACTLLAFVVFPNGIAAMQLGDGFIVIRGYKELGSPKKERM